MSQPLSPAAQAVDTALAACIQLQGEIIRARPLAVAAFRALVQHEGENVYTHDEGKFSVVREDRILAIAAELDGANPANQED